MNILIVVERTILATVNTKPVVNQNNTIHDYHLLPGNHLINFLDSTQNRC